MSIALNFLQGRCGVKANDDVLFKKVTHGQARTALDVTLIVLAVALAVLNLTGLVSLPSFLQVPSMASYALLGGAGLIALTQLVVRTLACKDNQTGCFAFLATKQQPKPV